MPIWVKQGTMQLPAQLSTPIIAVGPGTGCAIFRAFFEERHCARQNAVGPQSPSRDVFVFGCRHEQQDYLFRDEWHALLAEHTLDQLLVAFSRY